MVWYTFLDLTVNVFHMFGVFPCSWRRIGVSQSSRGMYCTVLIAFSSALDSVGLLFISFFEGHVSFPFSTSVAFYCAVFLVMHGLLMQKSFFHLLFSIWLSHARAQNVVWSYKRVCTNHIFGKQNRLCLEACYIDLEGASREGVHRLHDDHWLVRLGLTQRTPSATSKQQQRIP